MICFPNAKINIGLRVLEKRPDGFHNIESIFYPVGLCDALEIIGGVGEMEFELNLEGLKVAGEENDNLCTKAFQLLKARYKIPALKVSLLKSIPMGAGLGGGSSDAAFLLKLINDYCSLDIKQEDLKALASQIGSDCPFFIENKPSLVTGTGNSISPINIDLSKYYLSIVCPDIHVNTQKAYSLIVPQKREDGLSEIVSSTEVEEWRDIVVNDFEVPVFNLYPKLAEIKKSLYDNGAIYASMTGSGSAVYGLFKQKPEFGNLFGGCKIWTGKALPNI